MNDQQADSLPIVQVSGPYFDELEIGPYPAAAPGLTLDSGLAALHRAVVGDRLPLALDATLSARVTGAAPLADPALVWDVAIGQSTLATQRVKANLFYRGVRFRRMPLIGDTVRTRVDVVGLRANAGRPGRAPTGLVALKVHTVDQHDRTVLEFWRCAMLPMRPGATPAVGPRPPTLLGDDLATGAPPAPIRGRHGLDVIGSAIDVWGPPAFLSGWDLAAFEGRVPRLDRTALGAPMRLIVHGGDVVSSAPELARATLNVASVHADRVAAGGRRLVYGGHVIGIAAAQAARALPAVVTVLAWQSCDHVGPVHEGDTLFSSIEIRRLARLGDPGERGYLADLRSLVTTVGPDDDAPRRPVLDWRYVALLH